MQLLRKVSAQEERDYEKYHTVSQRDRYLANNALERYEYDRGYRGKVDLAKDFLENHVGEGYVLDLGAAAAGESEILFHFGHSMIPIDVNEIALSYSKIRAMKFRNENLPCFAADAHKLPFATETFDKVIVLEALHHMADIRKVLGELYRVLRPGGHMFTLEPYAYNPYRRLSEVRDYFRGTIEKSFSQKHLVALLEDANFHVKKVEKVVLPPSTWKKHYVSKFRAHMKDLHYTVAESMPSIFGNLALIAKKPGELASAPLFTIEERLICPITSAALHRQGGVFRTANGSRSNYSYPIIEQIPLLIESDAIEVPTDCPGSTKR